ncbi:hypothetical protein AAC387_Pa02g2980 [Persea americana]
MFMQDYSTLLLPLKPPLRRVPRPEVRRQWRAQLPSILCWVENLHSQPVLDVHQFLDVLYEPNPADHNELRPASLGKDADERVATGEAEGRGLALGGGGEADPLVGFWIDAECLVVL